MTEVVLQSHERPVAEADVTTRANFISRTYSHLLGGIVLFTLIETILFQTGIAERIARPMMGAWLLVLGAFMVGGWLGSHMAATARTPAMQYAGFSVFILLEALIFCPILFIASTYYPGIITSAAVVTLVGFSGLTAIVFTTRKDFSFLGGILRWAFFCALLLIVAAVLFNFVLGTIFSVVMIALAGAAILYDTSNVIHHYPEDRHVSAALALFASVALMFWYVLMLFMQND